MKLQYILKNPRTNEYFTNSYDCYWSMNINDAYNYDNENSCRIAIESALGRDYYNPLQGIKHIELVSIYCID